MPPKRKAANSYKRSSAKRKKNQNEADAMDVPVAYRIHHRNGSFVSRVVSKAFSYHQWSNTTSVDHITYHNIQYHVGDMVMADVIDDQLGTRQEPAVIADLREPYVLLLWLYETKDTEQMKKIVGAGIASAYDLILSVYSDVARVSALSSFMPLYKTEQVCIDWVLDSKPARAVCITEPRDDCFMRRLVKKIKVRKPIKEFAAPSKSPNNTLLDISYPSAPEEEEDGEPTALYNQPAPLPTSVEQSTESASTYIPTTRRHEDRGSDIPVEPSPTSPTLLALGPVSSSTEDGSVDSDMLAEESANHGSNGQENRIHESALSLYNSSSEISLTPKEVDLRDRSQPVRTVDEDTVTKDQQHQVSSIPHLLKQRYNQITESVLSGLRELQQTAKSEVQQLPQHLKDGLITFSGSFGHSVPIFDPEYLWDSSRVRSFSMPKGKHLLVTTLPVFQELLLRDDHEMPKYVLIKTLQPNPAIEAHWRKYLLEFLREHPNTDFEIQEVTDGEELTFSRDGSEVHSRLSNETSSSTLLRQGCNAQNMIPWNLLNIHGQYMHTSGLPAVQGIWRLNCLSILCEKIKQPDLLSVGKYQEPTSGSTGFSGCLNFTLLGERGSYSKTHVDLLGSTGIEILFGKKAWFLIDGDMTEEEKLEFAEQGQEWQPSSERVKMVPLGPDDTLLMMPGHLSPHSVITVETSLSRGGMFWDESKLSYTLENLRWTFEHPNTTNESIDPDITKIVDAVAKSQAPAAAEARKLKSWMLPRFSCKCKGFCGEQCPCFEGNELRNSGCSTWCKCGCGEG